MTLDQFADSRKYQGDTHTHHTLLSMVLTVLSGDHCQAICLGWHNVELPHLSLQQVIGPNIRDEGEGFTKYNLLQLC